MSISEKFTRIIIILLIVVLTITVCTAVRTMKDALDDLGATILLYISAGVQRTQVIVQESEPEEVIYEYKPLPTDYENIGAAEIAESDAVLLAQLMYGEYNNPDNYAQSAAVCWCVLNRLDAGTWGDTIECVITAPGQFHGYSAHNPVDADLYKIACDVLLRYELEKLGVADAGRVLPKEYLYFFGNGFVNTYRTDCTGGSELIP